MKRLSISIMFVVAAACSPSAPSPTPEQIERNNHGVALMGQYRNEDARKIFAELAEARPEWLDVRVNRAIAVLNRQEEGDERRALALVREVLADDPDHVRARYVAGLVHFYLGETRAALGHFERVLEAEPDDAHVAYFTAQAEARTGNFERALALYRQAIGADPYLRSAYYGAAQTLRRLERADEARAMLSDYQRFADNPRVHLAEFRYTRMGRLAEAKAVGGSDAERPARRPEGELFAPVRKLAELGEPGAVRGLTTADVDGDGRQDVLVNGPGASLVLLQTASGFQPLPDHPLSGIEAVRAAAWGDVDNDGRVDVYLCRDGANQLRSGARDWPLMDGHEAVADAGRCADTALLDADHDGDLDIVLINARGPGELFNNNLDGSWRRLTREPRAGLGEIAAGHGALAIDLDRDRDVDLVTLHETDGHRVRINDRLWRYRDGEGFDDFRATSLAAVTAADFAGDGRMALTGLDPEGRLLQWQPDADGRWRRRQLAVVETPGLSGAHLAATDFTGDGRPELLVVHARGFEVLAVAPESGRADVIHSARARLDALVPILLDAGRGPALAGIGSAGDAARLMLWPAGAGRHRFVALAPTGRSERAAGMRSNASGIGTGIVIRAGNRWMLADTHDRHSAPGQSLQPLSIGLAGHERADFVRLDWTDGVLQTETGLAAGEVHRIAEIQRQLASCPVLFAHDGEGFGFVSDLLGVAGIGFFHAPGEYSDPRPWEYFRFPEGSIAPRDGRYRIKIAEPMEEIAYLDTARLHAHDLPEGWRLVLDERMHTGGGPAPTGAAVFYHEDSVRIPARATNERGEEVTASVQAADFEAAPPGERDRRFLGRLAGEHVLTLEFGEVINPPGSTPVLVAEGWVEYPYSQTVFAAWQAGADYRSPTLEARADGRWHTVYRHFGYPAGMPREMSLPLADLPPETTALRLRSNLEIYWDRLAVVDAESAPGGAVSHALTPAGARVAKTGFARRDTLAQRRPRYDYSDRSPYWDTMYQTGFYTALGPVGPLVTSANDAYAVIGPGDELHLEFEAPPAPGSRFRRVMVLEVRGYAKDMDLYTRQGETVAPLPGPQGAPDRNALHREYLTRFQGGY